MSDGQIGRNLARLRGSMSQREVAEAMRLRGWKWNQGTVSGIEGGERPLRLAEAEDLARVLNLSAGSDLARGEWEARLIEALWSVDGAHAALGDAITQYLDAQVDLAVAADDERIDPERRGQAMKEIERTPEQVVRNRRDHHGFEEPEESGPAFAALLEAYRHERG